MVVAKGPTKNGKIKSNPIFNKMITWQEEI